MATRSKKFSRSRGVKVLLVLLYVACFAAVGAIAAYLPAFGYMDGNIYIMDALLADNYYESDCFADKVTSDYIRAESVITEAYNLREMEELQDRIDDLPYYVKFYYRGNVMTNNQNADIIFTVDESGISRYNGSLPNGLASRPRFYLNIYKSDDEHITIGYSQAQYDSGSAWWYQTRRNMQIVFISEIVLIVLGFALLFMLWEVSGEDGEGNVTFPKFLRLPFEISLIGAICTAVWMGFIIFNDAGMSALTHSHNGRIVIMAVGGFVMALTMLFLLYHAISIAVRMKNGKAYRGSIVGLAVYYALKLLKWLGKQLLALLKQAARFPRFIAEVFTGEFYKGTVGKRLIILDCIFIIATVINFLLFLAVVETALLVIIEILLLIPFVYGRFIILRDEAKLEHQIREAYYGNYSYKPKLSKNSPFTESSEMLSAISEQYRRGLEETVKAERTKMELVTNVSHDLKTPLTSIIGYIELLSKEELTGDAAEYVGILQRKSERLKNIVSDVFELAKTTSGEITVEREPLDLTRLSYQTLGEMEDKISASGLDIKVNICEPPVTVISDGKRLYRVIQNLLDNALKYSLRGTRIYYSLEKHGNFVYIIIKNIASYEMNFTKEEILERFTRGDKARSTEGAGLGLSIAQGFTLACGGTFDIELDGDMFKAIVGFQMVEQTAQPELQAVTADE